MAAVVMSPPSDTDVKSEIKIEHEPQPTLTPPASEEADKKDYDSGSELSDLEPEPEESLPETKVEDHEEIVPDHYYEGGKVPVFKPTMDQFRSFKQFIQKIDRYGMKSGIVKVIPPKEWRDALPPLDDQVKTVKVKNPITQEFHGTHGTYTQANIEKQRSYNLPQWKALCEESNHQPPAKRGERRRNQEKPTRGSTRIKNPPAPNPVGKKKGPGRPRIRPVLITKAEDEVNNDTDESKIEVPPTPTSPAPKKVKMRKDYLSGEEDSKPKGRQPKSKSVSSRRQHNRRDQAEAIDEEAFKDFEYRVNNQGEWTTERVQELETAYWKSLTFNNPMYGADMPGSLFDDSTESWNVAKLENLLDVLGQKVPGVNTAYLYLGMWKASFAWHLEDVDLYSINYIHFGAPKQWYSISQEDARRFEAAMKSVWPTDAKNCDQFLRHKTYLISPQLLQSQYNISVNRLVHNEGEFVITFPYGYHSGYNLGYNCAESVNFATESWLDYGRVARKCNCEADSVWVDVRDVERKLRGEPTPEYYEETDDEEDEDEEDEPTDLPTPPGSDKGKPKRSHKRKRDPNDKGSKPKIKRLRIKIKAPSYEPCILCPSDNKYEKLLPTDNGNTAHRRCALYTPETYISEDNGSEKVCDVARIDKARLELKCNFCRNKRGSVFQCSQKKCTRAYHATCAAQAGVQVDIGLVPIFSEDGTEYTDTGIDFRCRFHRSKRGKNVDGAALEENTFIRKHAMKLPIGEFVQMQYYQGDIFAGVVLENRKSEQTLLIEVLPKGDRVEVEYKWLLAFDPVNSQLPMPSKNAKPLPAELAQKSRTTAEDPANNTDPKANDPFCDPGSIFKWSEFDTCKSIRNAAQVKVHLDKPDKLWHYLGKNSTEAKPQYTGDLAKQENNPKANFIESVRIAAFAAIVQPVRKSYPASYPTGVYQKAANAARANIQPYLNRTQTSQAKALVASNRPYHGKYAITDSMPNQFNPRSGVVVNTQALHNQRNFQQTASLHHHQDYDNVHPNYRPSQPPSSSKLPLEPIMLATSPQVPPPPYKALGNYNYNRFPPQQPPQPQQQQSSYPRLQAPVANMMGTSPQVGPFGRAESVQRHPSATSIPLTPPALISTISATASASPKPKQEIKGVSHLPLSEKYIYLHEAEKNRPVVYQSPYAQGGGFTAAYLPCPNASPKARPRGPSVSEDFLMKRTPSQQEQVKQSMNNGKAQLLQLQQQHTQHRQSFNHQQQAQKQYSAHQHPQPTNNHQHPQPQQLPPSAVQKPHHSSPSTHQQTYSPQQPFYDPSSYSQYNHFSPSYASNPTHHQPTTSYHQPPPTPQYHQPQSSYASYAHHIQNGLQFQSPKDFQMQMQREAHTHAQGYDEFFRGLQSAAAHGSGSGTATYGSTGNEHESPLKYEMGGAGGEMLPMMREGGRF